jgi:hypothetical protein
MRMMMRMRKLVVVLSLILVDDLTEKEHQHHEMGQKRMSQKRTFHVANSQRDCWQEGTFYGFYGT